MSDIPVRGDAMTNKPEGISFSCPYCQRRLRVAGALAGRRVLCPNVDCRKSVVVPATPAARPPDVAGECNEASEFELAVSGKSQTAHSSAVESLPGPANSPAIEGRIWNWAGGIIVLLFLVVGAIALISRGGAGVSTIGTGSVAGPLAERSPKPTSGKTDDQAEEPEDVREAEDVFALMREAGFGDRVNLKFDLPAWVRFGSKDLANKHRRGDQFDKIALNREAEPHQEDVENMRLRFDRLSFKPVVPKDVEEAGLIVQVDLPMRVLGTKKALYQDGASLSGMILWIHASEADLHRFAFLLKNGRISPCTTEEAGEVRRNDGVLYHPEIGTTTLVMRLAGELDALKDIARNPKKYYVRIEVSNLHFDKPPSWGYFRRDALMEQLGNSQKLVDDTIRDPKNPQPLYYATAIAKDGMNPCPEILMAALRRLEFVGPNGECLGGYKAKKAVARAN